jgi:hypothetical protein
MDEGTGHSKPLSIVVLIGSPQQIFLQPFRGCSIGFAERVHEFAALKEQARDSCVFRSAARLTNTEETAQWVNFALTSSVRTSSGAAAAWRR